MNEEYVCVLVTSKKYKQMLEEIYNCKDIVIPEKYRNKNNEKWCDSVETLYSLPVEISTAIDEEIKYVTKEEYEEIHKKEIEQMDDFFKNYEPDYMWNWNK